MISSAIKKTFFSFAVFKWEYIICLNKEHLFYYNISVKWLMVFRFDRWKFLRYNARCIGGCPAVIPATFVERIEVRREIQSRRQV